MQTGRPEASCRFHHSRVAANVRSEGGDVLLRSFIRRILRRDPSRYQSLDIFFYGTPLATSGVNGNATATKRRCSGD
jgi:hypothetical protein